MRGYSSSGSTIQFQSLDKGLLVPSTNTPATESTQALSLPDLNAEPATEDADNVEVFVVVEGNAGKGNAGTDEAEHNGEFQLFDIYIDNDDNNAVLKCTLR